MNQLPGDGVADILPTVITRFRVSCAGAGRGAEKAASLPEQMIQNIANGRLQKFFKESTLEEQEYQMGDGKQSVKEAMAAVDKDAKVVCFKRFSLAD